MYVIYVHEHIYVCMHVRMYVIYVHEHIYVCMRVRMYVIYVCCLGMDVTIKICGGGHVWNTHKLK